MWTEHDQLRVVRRKKGLIIRNGFNIHPLDIEAIARECDGVEDAIAAGVSDMRVGERVVVGYVGSAIVESVAAHLRDRVAANKRPDEIRPVSEIPLTPIGKPDRKALAAQVIG